VRYEHILHEGHKAIATVMIDRLPNTVLDIQTMRETNQALQEISEHRKKLIPQGITHAGDKAFMERHKPDWKGA
jgi:hypothetical protein